MAQLYFLNNGRILPFEASYSLLSAAEENLSETLVKKLISIGDSKNIYYFPVYTYKDQASDYFIELLDIYDASYNIETFYEISGKPCLDLITVTNYSDFLYNLKTYYYSSWTPKTDYSYVLGTSYDLTQSNLLLNIRNDRWTDSRFAALHIPLNTQEKSVKSIEVAFDLIPFINPPELPSQELEIYVNGCFIDTLVVSEQGIYKIEIGNTVLSENATGINFTFIIPNATSPKSLGNGADVRKLGVNFIDIKLFSIE
jgi:hypothetical protein